MERGGLIAQACPCLYRKGPGSLDHKRPCSPKLSIIMITKIKYEPCGKRAVCVYECECVYMCVSVGESVSVVCMSVRVCEYERKYVTVYEYGCECVCVCVCVERV